MKSEETIYENKENMEEGTQLDDQSQESLDPQEGEEVQEQSQEVAEDASKAGKKSSWRKAVTGMGTGILLGGASSFLMGMMVKPEPIKDDVPGPGKEEPEIIGLEDGDVDMATTVNDDMSFSEAFAAARAEVGGGGAFVWNGNVYSTYTAEEWDAMTDEQKQEYYNNLNWTREEVETQDKPELEVVSTTPDNPVDEPATENLGVVDDEREVEGLGVAYDEATGANFGVMSVDGQEVIYVDVDNDGVFDVVTADMNHDGEYTPDEMADISNQHLTVDMFEEAMDNDVYLASNDSEPDYVNDALV